MAFLELDGWAVSTVKGGSQTDVAVGDIDSAYDGTPMSDIRYKQRTRRHTTPPLDADTASALMRYLLREGHSWDWSSDFYSFKGLGPIGGGAARNLGYGSDGRPLHTEDGVPESRFGAYALAFVGDTENILDSTQRDVQGATGFTAVNSAGLSLNTNQRVLGDRALTVIAALSGRGIENQAVACAASTQYAASAYLYSVAGVGVTLALIDDVGTITSSAFVLPAGAWTRLYIVGTTNVAATTLKLRVTTTSTSGTFITDAWQIEAGSAATPWADGATTDRGIGLVYDVTGLFRGHNGLTVSGWVRVGNSGSGTLFQLRSGTGAKLLSVLTLTTAGVSISAHGGSASLSILASYTWDDEWHHVAVTILPKRESDGLQEATVYIDGVAVASLDSGSDPDFPTIEDFVTLYVGSNNVGGQVFSGLIDDFRVYPFGITAAIAAGWASQTVAPGRCPRIRLTGDSVEQRGGVESLGADVSATFTGRYGADGSWHPAGREVSFTLQDVPQ